MSTNLKMHSKPSVQDVSSANWGQIIAINLFTPQLLAIIGYYWLLLLLLGCKKYYYYWLLLDYTQNINYWDKSKPTIAINLFGYQLLQLIVIICHYCNY